MKKRILAGLLLSMGCMLTACAGQTGTVSGNQVTGTAEAVGSLISSIDPADYIKLGQYKGLEVTRLSTKITEADIEAELKDSMGSFLEPVEVTDRDTVEKGDIANIDFVGKKDGVAFEGGTGQGYDLTIGSGTFIPGFEEGLIGAKVGEQTDLDLSFPDSYPNDPSLEGQPVVFEVKVNSIKAMPEITDEDVKKVTNGAYNTIKAYKESIKDELEQSAVQYADSAMYIDLWDQVVNNAELKADLPEDFVNEKLDAITKNAKKYAQAYGVDWETYLSQAMGITEDEFKKEASEYARKGAKESLVLLALAKAEGLELTQDEIADAMKEYVELYDYGSVEDFMEKEDMDEFREYVLMSKVQEFLADEAVIKTED